jgi:hypothetical protein
MRPDANNRHDTSLLVRPGASLHRRSTPSRRGGLLVGDAKSLAADTNIEPDDSMT